MPNRSGAGNLISKNLFLKNLDSPYNEYFAYYYLAEKLEVKLVEFFNDKGCIDKRSTFLNDISCKPREASSFLQHKAGDKDLILPDIDSTSTADLKCLLLGFFGKKLSKGELKDISTSCFSGMVLTESEKSELTKNGWFTHVPDLKRDSKLPDFWRRARRCNPKNDSESRNGHSALIVLDTISACSGYKSFIDFLNSEFGRNIDQKVWDALNSIYSSQPKENLPKELPEGKTFDCIPEPLSTAPVNPYPFIARNYEIKEIADRLRNGSALVMNGERGIGKSSLASGYYWQIRNLKEHRFYRQIAWVRCEAGIYSGLANMADEMGLFLNELKNDKEKAEQLVDHLSRNDGLTLLFLENANDREELLRSYYHLYSFGVGILWITRCGGFSKDLSLYTVPPLDCDAAKELFFYFCPAAEEWDEIGDLFDRLLNAISHNTLLVEIFSKRLEILGENGVGFKRFLEGLEGNGLFVADGVIRIETKYLLSKNDLKLEATIEEILDKLYDIEALDNDQQEFLVALALLPKELYELELLAGLLRKNDMRVLINRRQDLIYQGWIKLDEGGNICLQSIIEKVVIKKSLQKLSVIGDCLFQSVAERREDAKYRKLLGNFIDLLTDSEFTANNDKAEELNKYLQS